ncbi:MAG: hypothetical protein ACFBSC_07530 [Microcoleaceae cyanobacterium]
MNISEMRAKASAIKSGLSEANYGNFAEKNFRTGRPEDLTREFSRLLDRLEDLAEEAASYFPHSKVDLLFKEGKGLLSVRRRAVKNSDFEEGKATLLQVVQIIEENLLEEERQTPFESNLSLVPDKPRQHRSSMIFVSYDDPQILEQIETVFGMLGGLASEMDNLKPTDQNQLNPLATVSSRIDGIRSCGSAIICLPPQAAPDSSANVLAHLDLGACLGLFPERTLLIHREPALPENLVNAVETFYYGGNLDFQKGMELARQVLKILQQD